MNQFNECRTLEDVRTLYRALCKVNHPDKGGTTAIMQAINNMYEVAVQRILSTKTGASYAEQGSWYGSREEETEIEMRVRAAVEAVAHLPGLELEVVGVWVWASGNTKDYRVELKAAGYHWMHKKLMWAFKGKSAKYSSGNTSMDDIRQTYGSQRVHYTAQRVIGGKK